MPLQNDWIQSALTVTGHFEDSQDPLGGVSGDFDGMGISLGVLQWNIGSGSLQPLIKGMGRAAVVASMPLHGAELWNACNTTIPDGLSIVRGWQSGGHLPAAIVGELKALLHSPAGINQQIAAATDVAQRAFNRGGQWLGREPTKAEFCWFFDVFTQNGGMKDVTLQLVQNFIATAGTDAADDSVCDWLAARTTADNGFRDSRKNAVLWRNNVSAERLTLFVASYLRAQRSLLQWRADTLNRKGTIALGFGWVHGEQHNLKAPLGL